MKGNIGTEPTNQTNGKKKEPFSTKFEINDVKMTLENSMGLLFSEKNTHDTNRRISLGYALKNIDTHPGRTGIGDVIRLDFRTPKSWKYVYPVQHWDSKNKTKKQPLGGCLFFPSSVF